MFNRILVPLDGSKLAESALPAASYLSAKFNASVKLIHVVEQNPPDEVHGEKHLSNPEEASEYLKTIEKNSFSADTKVDYHVHTSKVENVVNSILQHVEEFETDLIVMCTHGSGDQKKFLFGSIAQQIIAMGKTPVLLIQPEAGKKTPQLKCENILVPLDGNPNHERGLDVAVNLSKTCKSQIFLLAVVPTITTLSGLWTSTGRLTPGTTSRLLDIFQENSGSYLDGHAEDILTEGLKVETLSLRGRPAKVITKTAKEIDADLIVLGTHGKSGMDAFWEGSVTPKVCRNCKLPLLLVPVKDE